MTSRSCWLNVWANKTWAYNYIVLSCTWYFLHFRAELMIPECHLSTFSFKTKNQILCHHSHWLEVLLSPSYNIENLIALDSDQSGLQNINKTDDKMWGWECEVRDSSVWMFNPDFISLPRSQSCSSQGLRCLWASHGQLGAAGGLWKLKRLSRVN